MLNKKQIEEIREHLDRAQNPIFFYDNDCDGLCSFLILRKYLGRGKGAAVKSFPDLNVQYARKARELNADYVFVLDKPAIAKEFIDEIYELNLPLVWIDHHDIPFEGHHKNFFSYNPTKNESKSEEPVSYIAYKILNRKENLWLAFIGCIADHYMPDFAEEFKEKYPEFLNEIKGPFDAYYNSEIGRIAQAFNFGLKDSTSNVVYLQNFLINCNGPEDVFVESSANRSFRKRYNEVKRKYDELIEKAKNENAERLIFFSYGGNISISADIANELSYRYPNKYICVAYKNGAFSNLSLRGKKIRRILERILIKFENASGGGHEDAVGARIQTGDLEKFKECLVKEI